MAVVLYARSKLDGLIWPGAALICWKRMRRPQLRWLAI